MYKELTPEDHRRILGIEADQVPDALLIVGVFNVHEGARRFATYLEDAEALPRFPGYLARYGNLKVGLVAAFGGPMAAFHAHSWIEAGVPAVVQLGWYGALQPGTSLGDVVVPRHAERQDGVSDWYLSKGILADATPELTGAITTELRMANVQVHEQAIYSTTALLAESREIISDWRRHGYHGVDMETAATFAVARSLGARRAAALIRYDDLINEEDHLGLQMARGRRHILREREALVTVTVARALQQTALSLDGLQPELSSRGNRNSER